MREIKLTKQLVEAWLIPVEPYKLFHYTAVLDGGKFSSPEDQSHLRKIFHDLALQRKVKPSGNRDGYYVVIPQVKPIRRLEGATGGIIDFAWPCGHGGDNSSFGFEGLMTVSEGDLILLGGVSNFGKTAIILNMLGENLDKYSCLLMGNEYVNADQTVTGKFRRRMTRMSWADWTDSEGNLKFILLPVNTGYEDYIEKDKINIIDWLNIPQGQGFYEIAPIMKAIKDRLGKGLAVVVEQKTRGKEFADGGEFSERFADIYLTIDPFGENESRLTVGKVKEPKERVSGRSWAFSIVDYGANLHRIREVKKCFKCWGHGYTKMGKCDSCLGKGYIDMD